MSESDAYHLDKELARKREEARLQAELYGRPPKHTASDRARFGNERFGTGTGKAKRFPKASNPRPGQRRAFELTRQALGYRMLQLLALPLDTLDRAALQTALQAIGRS